jgi:hypothetical protein
MGGDFDRRLRLLKEQDPFFRAQRVKRSCRFDQAKYKANRSRKPAAEIVAEAQNFPRKSLFRNIFHISPLKSKILPEFPVKSMILMDSNFYFFTKQPYVSNP